MIHRLHYTITDPASKKEWLEARTKVITSTEIGSLFGINPYLTVFELWHQKRDGSIIEIEQNERMKWGLRLEDSIARGIAEDRGIDIRRMPVFIWDDESRIGASFDYEVLREDTCLEIKNVDSMRFSQTWSVEDGEVTEAPPHIELQAQIQMMLSGKSRNLIGALVGGNKVVVIERRQEASIQDSITKVVSDFWKSIEEGNEPAPDFSVDSSFFCKLMSYAEAGKVVDILGRNDIAELASAYRETSALLKDLEGKKSEIKAKIIAAIGDAEKAIGDGFSISARSIGPSHVEYDRAPYRDFRISWKSRKEKE